MDHQRFGVLHGGGLAGRSQAADLLGVVVEPGGVQGGGEAEVVGLECPGAGELNPLGQQVCHGSTAVLSGVFIIQGSQVFL